MKNPNVSHENLPFYASIGFAVLVAVLVFVMFLIAAIVLLFILPLSGEGRTAAIAAVTGFAAPVLAVMVLLLRQQFNIELLNGHLESHVLNGTAANGNPITGGTAAP